MPSYHHSGRALSPGQGSQHPAVSCLCPPAHCRAVLGTGQNNDKNIFPISWEHAPWKFSQLWGHIQSPAQPSSQRKPDVSSGAGKSFRTLWGWPRQSQQGKKVSLRRKSLCSPKQHAAERVGWLQDKMDRMHSWTSSHHAAGSTLNASQPSNQLCLTQEAQCPGILMPSCSRGLLGLHWLLAQPSSHNPCPQSHTPPCLPALPSLAVYSLFACSLPFPCYVIRLY